MAYNYIVASNDRQAAQNKIEEIKKSLNFSFDEIIYDLEEDGVYSLIDELTTISLFSTPKFIIVKSAEALALASDKAINELCKAMNDINSENVLILLFYQGFPSSEKLDKIKKYASFLNIKFKNIPIDQYITSSLAEDGFNIDAQALSLWVSYQEDLASVRCSLEQVKCYKKDDKVITDQDIKLMIQPPLEDNVYQLVEAVLENDKKRMFSCFKDLKLRSIQASYLVSLILNKFQELYNVSILIKSNTSQADIASLFNVSSGRAYYMIKNAKNTNINKIKRNLSLLNELDYKIKIGKIDQNLGLELYFLE